MERYRVFVDISFMDEPATLEYTVMADGPADALETAKKDAASVLSADRRSWLVGLRLAD